MTKMAAVPAELIGMSGKSYKFMKLLQERPQTGCVWTAMWGHSATCHFFN
jgi:hypothetical protein